MEKDQKDSPIKFYAKYSTLAIQMMVIIVGSAFGGRALDKWLEWEFPVFTVALTMLGVVVALILGLCLVLVFFTYRYREALYQWIEKFNGKISIVEANFSSIKFWSFLILEPSISN